MLNIAIIVGYGLEKNRANLRLLLKSGFLSLVSSSCVYAVQRKKRNARRMNKNNFVHPGEIHRRFRKRYRVVGMALREPLKLTVRILSPLSFACSPLMDDKNHLEIPREKPKTNFSSGHTFFPSFLVIFFATFDRRLLQNMYRTKSSFFTLENVLYRLLTSFSPRFSIH